MMGEEDDLSEGAIEEAKELFKNERIHCVEKKKNTVFADVVRSKGFLWLSNKPECFFEWSQAGISANFVTGGWWVCTNPEMPASHVAEGEIGDRAQNLVIIGKNILDRRADIEARLDACLVVEFEWQSMLRNGMK